MWFFTGAVIIVVLLALRFRRTNLYRARRGGRVVKPGQGFDVAGRHEGNFPE